MARKTSALETAISKKVGRAIFDYAMIRDSDRILVAVSGGKDSLTLLKVLCDRRLFVPIRYDVTAVHVVTEGQGDSKEQLRGFFESLGCAYRFKKLRFPKSEGPPTCFWCSWNRRKVLFQAAAEYGCNKVALGHHKDDIVETILLNLFFEGEISAMGPSQEIFKGKITLIRPLAYVEEKEIEKLARLKHLPVVECRCPHAATSKRALVKKWIRELEANIPNVKTNIFRSLQRIKKDYLL